MPSFQSDAILRHLDKHAGAGTFPRFDNARARLVDTRLTAWCDDKSWAIAIEILAYEPQSAQLEDSIHRYGNRIEGPTGLRNSDIFCVVESEVEDPARGGHVDPEASAVRVRGVPIPVPAHQGPWPLVDFYRSLVPRHRNRLLADAGQLQAHIPRGLAQVLRLDAWRHPDPRAGELPSGSATFRMIAEVLCSGDAKRYAPGEPANTAWSDWPEGEAL